MSPILALLLCAFILPLFISSWRVGLICLAGQGCLMAWLALGEGFHPDSPETVFAILDYAVIRGIGLPWALYAVLRSRQAPYAVDIIPPNLLAWISALGLVLLAFNFTPLLTQDSGGPRHAVSVVAAGVLLGFFILSTAKALFGQMLGAVYIENSIALFEASHGGHADPWAVRLGMTGVAVATFALYRWFLANGVDMQAENLRETPEGPAI